MKNIFKKPQSRFLCAHCDARSNEFFDEAVTVTIYNSGFAECKTFCCPECAHIDLGHSIRPDAA